MSKLFIYTKDGWKELGKNGLDGSPDSPEQIRDKLTELKGDQRLDAKAIKNLPIAMGGGNAGLNKSLTDKTYLKLSTSNKIFGVDTNGDEKASYIELDTAYVVTTSEPVGTIYWNNAPMSVYADGVRQLVGVKDLATSGQLAVWNQTTGVFDSNYNINDYLTIATAATTYLKLDASNDPLTGQLSSNVATGTSPFDVASTTLNTNLNADLLDGQHGSYYAPLSNVIVKSPTAIEDNLITIPDATYKGLVIKGASSQSANLQEWQDIGGTSLCYIAPSGDITESHASGFDGATPVSLNLYSTNNGTWIDEAIFSQITFGNADTSGAGDGGVKAKISAYVDDASATYTGMSFYTSADGTTISERMRINYLGLMGINTIDPSAWLHVVGDNTRIGLNVQTGSGLGAIKVGADVNAGTVTASARKVSRIVMPSYDAGSTNTFLFGGDIPADGSMNGVYFGGITGGSQYASTYIGFYTGATTTTTGGTERMSIDSTGLVSAKYSASIYGSLGIGTGAFTADKDIHIQKADGSATIRLENSDTSIIANQSYGTIEWEGQDASASANGIRANIEVLGNPTSGTTGDVQMAFRVARGASATLHKSLALSNGSSYFNIDGDMPTTLVTLYVRGSNGQTGALQNWQSTADNVTWSNVAQITAVGRGGFGGSAGSASTIQATAVSGDQYVITANANSLATVGGINITGTIIGSATSQTIRAAQIFSPQNDNLTYYSINNNAQVTGARPITSVVANYLNITLDANHSGVVTNAYNLYANNPTNSGTGSITNNYGLYIENMTAGTSINQAIRTNGGDVSFGTITGQNLILRRVDTSVTANDMVGKIQFYAQDTSTTTNFIVADIEAQATNTITTDINPGRLIFRTTPTTVAATPLERMRITEAGVVKTSYGRQIAVVVKTADYTATSADHVIKFKTNNSTLTLPAATGSGQIYLVRAVDCIVTINPNGTETLNEELTQTLNPGDSVQIVDEETGLWGVY